MQRSNLVLVVVLTLAGCGGRTQRGTPAVQELRPTSVEVARGERLFQKFCYQCHPGGAAGLGPSINDKPLPEIAIRTQIRTGVGAMPAFDHTWMSDAEVAAVAEYVQALRASPRAPQVADR